MFFPFLFAAVLTAATLVRYPFAPPKPRATLILPRAAPGPQPSPVLPASPARLDPAEQISEPVPNVPWGSTEKVGEHLYRTYVGRDERMGTPSEILSALNSYRRNHNQGELFSDEKLCSLAKMRAEEQEKMGKLDTHKGIEEYMKDPNHWKELNITALGENSSFGYVLSGVHLIEWVFDAD